MANVQENQVLADNQHGAVVKTIRVNDGAGNDSGTVVVDASALANADGDEILSIVGILASVGGPSTNKTVTLYWGDTSTDKIITGLSGNVSMPLRAYGLPAIPCNAASPTGDIKVTTTNFAAGDYYTIIIDVRKVSGYAISA